MPVKCYTLLEQLGRFNLGGEPREMIKGLPENDPYVLVEYSSSVGQENRLESMGFYIFDKKEIKEANELLVIERCVKERRKRFEIRMNKSGLEFIQASQ